MGLGFCCDACNARAWPLQQIFICSCCDDLADFDYDKCENIMVWGEVCEACFIRMHTKEEDE